MEEKKTSVVCVDDEPAVLEGMMLHLGRRYEVHTAQSGVQALELLARLPEVAVIISDMRMPGMDGATFLGRARVQAPEAVRILLTGVGELRAAVAAINEGQIFRFISKPCAPAQLLQTVEAARAQYALVTAERVLLEDTLNGCIKAMTDLLAAASPLAFGRASRAKECVGFLAHHLGIQERWHMQLAAVFSQVGLVSVPEATLEKMHLGTGLTASEQKMLAQTSALAEKLLRRIPRMEPVREILAAYRRPFSSLGSSGLTGTVERGAAILRVAVDFDELESQATPIERAVDILRGREGAYDPRVIDALGAIYGDRRQDDVREVPLSALRVGMTLMADMRSSNGMLLAPRGYEITHSFVERAKNFSPRSVVEPLRVVVHPEGVSK